ncbi:hypothetical protein GDO86_005078 [Hymenochirus boettgeri]|uniref:Secreted protein n=1 Tax=Hymenochirus boettgeri TaxID=247094 RepID=A0A8T2J0M2_9PIPI|nr:hypothetical protein GDO86_005078 [Hymenochirus boettgeri]
MLWPLTLMVMQANLPYAGPMAMSQGQTQVDSRGVNRNRWPPQQNYDGALSVLYPQLFSGRKARSVIGKIRWGSQAPLLLLPSSYAWAPLQLLPSSHAPGGQKAKTTISLCGSSTVKSEVWT